jgi:hypothetical protein
LFWRMPECYTKGCKAESRRDGECSGLSMDALGVVSVASTTQATIQRPGPGGLFIKRQRFQGHWC